MSIIKQNTNKKKNIIIHFFPIWTQNCLQHYFSNKIWCLPLTTVLNGMSFISYFFTGLQYYLMTCYQTDLLHDHEHYSNLFISVHHFRNSASTEASGNSTFARGSEERRKHWINLLLFFLLSFIFIYFILYFYLISFYLFT